MRHVLLGLVALTLVPSQEDEPEVDVAGEIEALIARTNELESFHVVYEVEAAAGIVGSGKLEMSYQAPDIARFAMWTEDTQIEVHYRDTGIYFHSDADGWKRCPVPEPSRASEILEELFPSQERALDPGCSFYLRIQESEGEEQLRMNLGVSIARDGRRAVLEWLPGWKARASEVTVEGDVLVVEASLYSIRISRETGFPEEIRFTRKPEDGAMRLVEARFDEALEERLRTIPEEAREAEVDEKIAAAFQDPRRERHDAFHRVERMLEEGLREWNGVARNDWGAFLDALHREALEERYSGWRTQLEESTAQLAEWVRASRRADASEKRRSELEEVVIERRAKREESLLGARDRYLESLSTLGCPHGEPRQELFDVEQEVVEELWAELMSEPLLTAFDEELEAALGE